MNRVRFEANEKLVLVIASGADARELQNRFGNYRKSPNDILSSKDPRIDRIGWHAVYGEPDGRGRVTWSDDQRVRPDGPWPGDYVLYFSNK